MLGSAAQRLDREPVCNRYAAGNLLSRRVAYAAGQSCFLQ